MNAIGATFVWAAVQVTLFTAAGSLAYLIARRRGPAWGSLAAASALAAVLFVSLLTISPWPRWWNVGARSEVAQVASVATSNLTDRSNTAPVDAYSTSPAVIGEDSASIKARLESEIAASQGQAALLKLWEGMVDGLRTGRARKARRGAGPRGLRLAFWRWRRSARCG